VRPSVHEKVRPHLQTPLWALDPDTLRPGRSDGQEKLAAYSIGSGLSLVVMRTKRPGSKASRPRARLARRRRLAPGNRNVCQVIEHRPLSQWATGARGEMREAMFLFP